MTVAAALFVVLAYLVGSLPASWLAGRLPQGRIGIGPAAVRRAT